MSLLLDERVLYRTSSQNLNYKRHKPELNKTDMLLATGNLAYATSTW